MSSENPLVSVVCLCYNHEHFIRKSVESVLNQSYKNIEVIIVDDCSTDNSRQVIQDIVEEYPQVKILLLDENIGNTKAFNKGLALSSGDFIIDLATDDILLEDRVKIGVEEFEKYDDSYGVNFSNAINIDQDGNVFNYHYSVDAEGNAITKPPQGDLYKELIQKYFICSPTMMVKRSVFERLNGYDENLAYEDFDFWVRSARYFNYCYTDKVLVQRRRIKNSMSALQYGYRSKQMVSTYIVCCKIKLLNKTLEENKALKIRIYHELKQCLKYFNFSLIGKYFKLYLSI